MINRTFAKTAIFLQVMLCAFTTFASERAHVDSERAFPYDLAFSAREFRAYDDPAVSPDGDQVAYVVVTPPETRPQTDRFLPNGTPVNAIGAHIRVVATDAKSPAATRNVCDEHGNQWAPSWSPDGRSLAFYSDADGPVRVWSYSLDSGACIRIATAAIMGSVFSGSEPRWSPDGSSVYVPLDPKLPEQDSQEEPGASGAATNDANEPLAPTIFFAGDEGGSASEVNSRSGSNEQFMIRNYNATLAAVDIRSGQVRTLASADARPRPYRLQLSPSGRWLSYSSMPRREEEISVGYVMDLVVLPTTGGSPKVVAEALASSQHKANYSRLDYRWHPREDRLFYLKDGGLWSVTFDGKGPQAPQRMASTLGEFAPVILYLTRDASALVVGVEPKGTGGSRVPRKLAAIPLDGSKPIVLALPDDEKWQFLDLVRADEDTLWQPDARYVSAVARERYSGEQAILRLEVATGWTTMLAKGLHQIGKFAAGGDHGRLVAIHEDMATPPNLYRFSTDVSRGARLSIVDPRLEGRRYGTVKVIETLAPQYDGTRSGVRTTLLLPPGAKRGDRLPGIVMIYSGSDLSTRASQFGGDMGNTVPNQVFVSRGYVVIMANIVLGPEGVASHPLQQMTDEILAQVHAVAGTGYVDINRIAVSGQSYGGYSAAAIVSQTQLFRAAIPVNGPFDLASFYGGLDEKGNSHWIGWAEKGQGRMGDSPWADSQRYIANSPFYRVDRIRTPLLIVAGDNDRTVPYAESKKLFVGLRRLGRPAQLAIYPGEGHVINTWSRAHAIDVSQRMVEFLGKHLGVP